MRLYKIISESAALLMLASGLIVAPFSAFTHDCSECPAPCCSNEESGCCGDSKPSSCAEHPLCDDCAVFFSQNATLSGSAFETFIRSHLTVKYPVQDFLKQAEAYKRGHTVSADFFSNNHHSPSHCASTVLRI
jgi:hypothetical protein